MDSYDVFIKLTKGAKFKKEVRKTSFIKVGKQLNTDVNSNPDPLVVKIKEEPLLDYKTSADQVEDDLVLLGSMVANVKSNKAAKKRKHCLDDDQGAKKAKLLEQEKTNHFRNVNQIKTIGAHIANPIANFDELNIDCDLIKNLVKCGYAEPTPIQKQAITVMLEQRNILACAPTGSGKTAAFSIPIIQLACKTSDVKALVICPTRELAKQTQREFARLAEGRNMKITVVSKVKEGSKQLKNFVTTPNRLCFLLSKNLVSLEFVRWLIIDEADKLFEEGANSFRDQLQQVFSALDLKRLKVGLFSATNTPVVSKWGRKNLKGLIRVTVGQRNAATDSVEQELLFVGNEAGKLIAFRDAVRGGVTPPVLVFVQSRERAQQLFTELIYDGINVAVIHSDQTQSQRDSTVKSFREGAIWILICTDLMGRGIDFKGVNLVINYDFPTSAISYVHRIGRAGRAGRNGKAITYFTVDDTVNLRSIAHVLKQSGCHVPDYMFALKKRSKTQRKKLMNAAPKRADISVTLSKKKMRKKRESVKNKQQ